MTPTGPPARGLRRLLVEPRRPDWVASRPNAPWLAVAAVCVGAFMGQLDASIVTVALPTIGRDLHADLGSVQWVALAYLLTLVATVITAGRISDAVGRKLLYTYGFGVFTVASLLCGLAPSLDLLVAARVLQGVGAALLQANSVALIAAAVPRDRLARAYGIQGAAQAVGLGLGPAVGGLLVAAGGWRLVFLVNLPAGVVGIVLAVLLLPRTREFRRVPVATPAAALRDDLALLRIPGVLRGVGVGLLAQSVLFGVLFVVPFYLESAQGLGPGAAGLELAVLPAAFGVAAPLAGRLGDRRRNLAVPAMLLVAGALAVAAAWRGGTGPRLAELAVIGAGLGVTVPANTAAVMGRVPAGRAGLTSGVINMTRALGTSLGVVVAGTVDTLVASGVGGSSPAGRGFAAACAALATLAVGAALVSRR